MFKLDNEIFWQIYDCYICLSIISTRNKEFNLNLKVPLKENF